VYSIVYRLVHGMYGMVNDMRNFKDAKTPVFKFKLVHVHDSTGVHVQMQFQGRVVDRKYADNSVDAKRVAAQMQREYTAR
jgi:hypothetical protein